MLQEIFKEKNIIILYNKFFLSSGIYIGHFDLINLYRKTVVLLIVRSSHTEKLNFCAPKLTFEEKKHFDYFLDSFVFKKVLLPSQTFRSNFFENSSRYRCSKNHICIKIMSKMLTIPLRDLTRFCWIEQFMPLLLMKVISRLSRS